MPTRNHSANNVSSNDQAAQPEVPAQINSSPAVYDPQTVNNLARRHPVVLDAEIQVDQRLLDRDSHLSNAFASDRWPNLQAMSEEVFQTTDSRDSTAMVTKDNFFKASMELMKNLENGPFAMTINFSSRPTDAKIVPEPHQKVLDDWRGTWGSHADFRKPERCALYKMVYLQPPFKLVDGVWHEKALSDMNAESSYVYASDVINDTYQMCLSPFWAAKHKEDPQWAAPAVAPWSRLVKHLDDRV